MSDNTLSISGPFCSCDVQRLGGMLGPAVFQIGNNRSVEPLAVAPWANDPPERLATVDPLLRRLRGEWPCVPFGVTDYPTSLPQDWKPQNNPPAEDWNTDAHGYSSHHEWNFEAHGEDFAELSISYPQMHPIASLRRRVAIAANAPQIDIELEVTPRIDCTLPIGLHPVLTLPEKPQSVRLGFAEQARAWTFPIEVEPGRTALLPDQRDHDPENLKLASGERINLRHALPFMRASEDLVLLTGVDGRLDFDNLDAGYRVSVLWNAEDFPACLLWISNGGRQFYPWNGRFHGIGIEPICAPFDLGVAVSGDTNNPLSRSGIKTAQSFRGGKPWRTSYSISCSAIP